MCREQSDWNGGRRKIKAEEEEIGNCAVGKQHWKITVNLDKWKPNKNCQMKIVGSYKF